MMDILDTLFSSESVDSLIAKVKFHYILDRYPWLPFLVLLAIGVIVTLIVLLVRRKRSEGPVQPQSDPRRKRQSAPQLFPQEGDATFAIPQNFTSDLQKKSGENERWLQCISGPLKGKVFPLQGLIQMGRDPHKCQIVFPEDTKGISRVHCSVAFDGKRHVTVCDENSSYGTLVDGQRITSGKTIPLHRGQKLSLGSQTHTFVLKGHSTH